MATKAELHKLVDALPESDLSAAKRFLEELLQRRDEMEQALDSAPDDDEPSTPEEDAAADEAWQEYLRGEALSAEEAKQRLLP